MDIIRLFEWTCNLLNIYYTTVYHTIGRIDVNIRRRKDVKIIESIYGSVAQG